MKVVEAVALLRGTQLVSLPSNLASHVAAALPLFISVARADDEEMCFFSFALTSETGKRLHVHALSVNGCGTLCLLSRHSCALPFYRTLVALANEQFPAVLRRMLALMQVLLWPPPSFQLDILLPSKALLSFFSPPAGFPLQANPLHWELLLALGIQHTLDVWRSLLLERSVLLVSDSIPLLSIAANAFLCLLHPLVWQTTFVPFLPESLLAYVEAPTPFLMGASKSSLLATSLDVSHVLLVDLDMGFLQHASIGLMSAPLPPLPCDAHLFLRPLVPMLRAHRNSRLGTTHAAPPSAAACAACMQACFHRLLTSLLQSSKQRSVSGHSACSDDQLDKLDSPTDTHERSPRPDWFAHRTRSSRSLIGADRASFHEQLRQTLLYEQFVKHCQAEPKLFEPLSESGGAHEPTTLSFKLRIHAGGSATTLAFLQSSAVAAPEEEAHGSPLFQMTSSAGRHTWHMSFDRLAQAMESESSEAWRESDSDSCSSSDEEQQVEVPDRVTRLREIRQIAEEAAVLKSKLREGDALLQAETPSRAFALEVAHCVEQRMWNAPAESPPLHLLLVLRASYLHLCGPAATLLALDDLESAWAVDDSVVQSAQITAMLRTLSPGLRQHCAQRQDGIVARQALELLRASESARAQRKTVLPPLQSNTGTPPSRETAFEQQLVSLQQTGAWHGKRALNCCSWHSHETRDAVTISMDLITRLVRLFRKHSDSHDAVHPIQLPAIGATKEFQSIVLDTAELRSANLSVLNDEQRVAFWLNCYNLCIMHGSVACASRLRSKVDAFRVLLLHYGWFSYEIGGQSFSCVQMEHAVLRAGRPRPAFFGTNLVIPKFRASDPRLQLCPNSREFPLLMFGMVPGTTFSPPLRVYQPGTVQNDLLENAQQFLEATVEVQKKPSDSNLTTMHSADQPQLIILTLPIQLLWHQQDVAKNADALIRFLLPLLSAERAQILRPLLPLTSASKRISIQYAPYNWQVVFRLPKLSSQPVGANDFV